MTSLFDRLNWDLEFFNSFYIAAGGPASDPHDLDRDNDGNACDNNGETQEKRTSYNATIRHSEHL